ncbi:MAG: hypothetical protein Q8J99_15310 [Sulfuritalea sp.]|nr:hypothetical protein [Sulfuritalea sp.]
MNSSLNISAVAAVVVALFSPSSFADSADARFRIGDVHIGIGIGPPPPPIVEYVPVALPGHFWAPGYWVANGHRHVWKRGAWVRVRAGYNHVAAHWVQRGGHWYMAPPRWEAHGGHARRGDRHDYARHWRYGDDRHRRSAQGRDGRRDLSR